MRCLANMEIETNIIIDVDTAEVLINTYTADQELIEEGVRFVDLVDEFLESMVYDNNGLTKASKESAETLRGELMAALEIVEEELLNE